MFRCDAEASEKKIMKRMIAALACLLITLAVPAFAQEKEDIAAAVRATLLQLIEFSNKEALQTPEARKLLAGEALEWKMPTFGQLAASPDTFIFMPEAQDAVGRIQLAGKERQVDLYFYLTLHPVRVTAVRTLALTGIVEGAYQYLKSKPARTADEENECANMELLLSSDKVLRDWFRQHATAMSKLYEAAKVMKSGDFSSADNPQYAELKRQLLALHFSLAEMKENGNVEFVIGGVTDNTVGFLYSPTDQPPRISSNQYIWVEGVAPRWYLFRTT